MAKEIPVYLFVGFLESGKTKFIQETFEDPNFDSGDKTLLLICEEGEEEYNEKKFAFPGVTVKVLEDKSELNPQNLAKLGKEADAGRVVIEYNGMWLLQDLADALPENWLVYQCIATADGTTALTYAVQDIQFVGFPCSSDGYKALEQRAWVRVTAKVGYKFHNIYRGKGPVLTAVSVEPAEKPLEEVVTFS